MEEAGEKGASGARPSVCIVTSELVGPYKNGGIGTSMTGLAMCLAAAGFPVTVLYTSGKFSSAGERERWRLHYAAMGIALDWIRHEDSAQLSGPVPGCGFAAPYLVYLYLRERSFDVIQFNDCMGEGFYCLTMKRLGAAFGGTAMFVGLHSPSQWIFEINRTLPDSLLFAAFNHAERLSVAAADLLWSPSRYLLDWTRTHGFAHPPATIVQRYVLPGSDLSGQPAPGDEAAACPERVRPREIVFFGRLEERKGLPLFCRALHLVEDLIAEKGIAITFLGKPGTVGDRPALELIEDQARGWRGPWTMISDLGQQEAVDYLRSRAALAVIASPADNSPCTVYEAIAYRIPFLAARAGGIPELIADGDRAMVLFDHDAEALAARLRSAILDGVAPARAAEDPALTRRRWIAHFEGWRDHCERSTEREAERRLCVVVDGARDADIEATLASLDIPEVGRVLVIDRRWPRLAASARMTLIPPDRPQELVHATGADPGEAILLLRAGCVLLPHAGRALIDGLCSPEVDGLIPAAAFAADGRMRAMPPLGGSAPFCLFEGAAPSGACVVKAEKLAAAAAGSAPAPDAEWFGLADFAVAQGLEIWPHAERLVQHPRGRVADVLSRRAPERIAAYASIRGADAYYAAAIGYGGFAPDSAIGGLARALRERLVAMGLGGVARRLQKIVPSRLIDRIRRPTRS